MFDKIKIVTDSTTSLSQKDCEEMGIICLETTYTLDGVLHTAFDEEEIQLPEYYKKLEAAKSFSTGCVNVETFEKCFDELASQGYQVIYTGISGVISSTFSHSQTAAKNINEKYGQEVIYVVDSRAGSYATLMFIDKMQDLIKEGKTPAEIVKIISEDTYKAKVAFVVSDLKFLLKSGRISALALGVGTLLKIIPTIYIGEDGHFVARDKAIGKKLALKKLKNNFTKYINENNCTKFYITSCNMDEDVEDIKQHIAANTNIKIEDMKTGYIDKTMACGCGPKTVAAFCV